MARCDQRGSFLVPAWFKTPHRSNPAGSVGSHRALPPSVPLRPCAPPSLVPLPSLPPSAPPARLLSLPQQKQNKPKAISGPLCGAADRFAGGFSRRRCASARRWRSAACWSTPARIVMQISGPCPLARRLQLLFYVFHKCSRRSNRVTRDRPGASRVRAAWSEARDCGRGGPRGQWCPGRGGLGSTTPPRSRRAGASCRGARRARRRPPRPGSSCRNGYHRATCNLQRLHVFKSSTPL